MRGVLFREGLGQVENAGLAGAIVHQAWFRLFGEIGAGVHDGGIAAGGHAWDQGAAKTNGAHHVDLETARPPLVGQVFKGRGIADAKVVDEDIRLATEGLSNIFNSMVDPFGSS